MRLAIFCILAIMLGCSPKDRNPHYGEQFEARIVAIEPAMGSFISTASGKTHVLSKCGHKDIWGGIFGEIDKELKVICLRGQHRRPILRLIY